MTSRSKPAVAAAFLVSAAALVLTPNAGARPAAQPTVAVADVGPDAEDVQAAAVPAPAQAPAPAPAAPGAQTPSDPGTAPAQKKPDTPGGRLFFFLPNYLTVQGSGAAPPLTNGQKFKVVARSSFDYVQYPWYGFLAGISQADNSEPVYGRGVRGYAKRYATSFTDGTIENFTVGAIMPALFGEDPRYFQMGSGGFLRRAGYSVSRIVVTRTDSGHRQFNFAEVFGSALAAAASNGYHPRGERTLGNSLDVWRTLVAYDTLTNLLKEFWPDLRRIL